MLINQLVLHHRRIYGINSRVTNNLAWSDESTIAYVASHSIVLYDRRSKRQRFLNFNSEDISDSITSFAVGVTKKLAAVAERGTDTTPKVHVFDFKKNRRVKTLNLEETETHSKVDNESMNTLFYLHVYVYMCMYSILCTVQYKYIEGLIICHVA